MPDEYDRIFNEIENISGLKESAIKAKTAIRPIDQLQILLKKYWIISIY